MFFSTDPSQRKDEIFEYYNKMLMRRNDVEAYWLFGGNSYAMNVPYKVGIPWVGWLHHKIIDYGVDDPDDCAMMPTACQVCDKYAFRYLHVLHHKRKKMKVKVCCEHALLLCAAEERRKVYCPCDTFHDEWKLFYDLCKHKPIPKPVKEKFHHKQQNDMGWCFQKPPAKEYPNGRCPIWRKPDPPLVRDTYPPLRASTIEMALPLDSNVAEETKKLVIIPRTSKRKRKPQVIQDLGYVSPKPQKKRPRGRPRKVLRKEDSLRKTKS